MKIIVYRKYHESDLYELTLEHTIYSTEHNFIHNKDIEQFSDAFEDGCPFEIIDCDCTELEFEVFVDFLFIAFDIFNTDEIRTDRILVKGENEVLDYRDAARQCYDELKEAQEKIESLQWDIDIYDEIYHDKYGCHITEEFRH